MPVVYGSYFKCCVCDCRLCIVCFESDCDSVCTECLKQDKLKHPVLLLKKVQRAQSVAVLSDFEQFTLYYSDILKTNIPKRLIRSRLLRSLKRLLVNKFE